MQTYLGPLDNVPGIGRGVALGFFDGLHRGHADLIRTLLYHSARRGLQAAVFTFDRHPDSVLHPGKPFAYLDTLQERLDLLAGLGLDEAHVYPFDERFASLAPEAFLEQVLVRTLQATLLVVGPDYRFGAGGRGDIQLLRRWSDQNSIELVVVDEVVMAGSKVASSRIRELVRDGEVTQAASLLGRPYTLRGVVQAGRGLGHRLGFPTANIPMPPDKTCPALGVYASRVRVFGRTWAAITSIGLRPTVSPDETVPIIESYLYDVDLPLYGAEMMIELLAFIRPEARFRSLLQLSTQIKADLDQVRAYHRQAEHCYEQTVIHGIPLWVLPSDRFARAALHLVFQVQATPRQLACHALLIQVLTATCRQYPDRTRLALALDNLYGASLEGSVEKNGDLQTLYLSVEALARWTDGSSPFRSVCDIVFATLLEPDTDEEGMFRSSIVEAERNNLIMALMARQNDKIRQAYDRCLHIYCQDQVHGLNASGRLEDLRTITRTELQAAYETLLSRMNLTVYLGGRIDNNDCDHVGELIRRMPMAERAVLYPGRIPTPCLPAAQNRVTEHKEGEQAWLIMAYDGLPPYFSQQSTALLLNNMLGGEAHALLFDVIREKMGLAYQVFSMGRSYLSALFVLAGVSPAAVEQTIKAVSEQVSRLADGQFDDLLMQRSRRMLISTIRSLYDELSGLLAVQIGSRISGRFYSQDDALMLLDDVTREQISQCAAALTLRTTYVLLPGQAASPNRSAGQQAVAGSEEGAHQI